MAILVTGGKGYIGVAVIRKLLNKGHKIICLDLKTSPGRLSDIADQVTMLKGGVPGLDELVKIIQDHNIDRIAHTVFFQSASGNAGEIHFEISSMVMGTINVYEAARQTGVKRVVFPSSIHYYGPQWLHGDVYLNEESPSLAQTIYGIGKKLNETTAYTYNIWAGMSIVSLRLPAVYGPGARIGARGVNIAAVECARGKPAVLAYPSEDKVCVGHIDDVAEAIVTILLAANVKHYVYNIGGHTISYWELASLIKKFLPDAKISFNEKSGKTDLPYLIDYSRIKEEFGFKHRLLSEGYLDLINTTRREAGLPEVKG